MTTTVADIDIGTSWQDLTVTAGSIASADVLIQNVGGGEIAIVFGGGAAPSGKTGTKLGPNDSVQGNAANIWARAIESSGRVGLQLT